MFENMKDNRGMNKMKKRYSMIFMTVILAVILVGGITIFFRSDVSANNEAVIRYEKVQIEDGDSLWSIARAHYAEPCGDIRDYVDQIKACNDLESDHITEGQYLCVPVYTKGY
jgi:cell division protein YceG involved in septum cleavage